MELLAFLLLLFALFLIVLWGVTIVSKLFTINEKLTWILDELKKPKP